MRTTRKSTADPVMVDRYSTASYQRQRVELVAGVLCSLDEGEPGGSSWPAYLSEAARYVAAFSILQLHADAVTTARRGATTGH